MGDGGDRLFHLLSMPAKGIGPFRHQLVFQRAQCCALARIGKGLRRSDAHGHAPVSADWPKNGAMRRE